jgi:hypothetical protein
MLLLVVAVLPAEYNIDPTGLGKKLGLTVLSQSADSTVKASVISCPEQTQSPQWKDTIVILVPPKKGLEYKFYVQKGEALEFTWETNGESLYFDFHGEPEGDTTGYFKSYKLSTQNQSSGTLSVPFTGVHGWYWENKTNKPISITLKTRGKYKKIGLL